MYFKYDEKNGINVPEPFNRMMTPLMVKDNVERELPFSVHYTEWQPGSCIDAHIHENAMEMMFCVSGKAKAMVNGEWFDLVPDSMIVADKYDEHSIVNDGDELLRVLCVFSPAISAKDLRDRAFAAIENAKKK
jgi:mannose-6-phosphate isomerase-like protein (cupin superfamily)